VASRSDVKSATQPVNLADDPPKHVKETWVGFGVRTSSEPRHARGHSVSGKKRKKVGENPPIADAFAALDHTPERKKDEEGKGGGWVAPALLLTRVVVVRSVPGSRRPPAPVAVFESCMLTMRTERGMGLRPPEKGTSVRFSLALAAPPGCSA